MMKDNKKLGFTVMELLVVIVIIGILATVILSLSGDARNNAIESKIKGEMNSLAKQAAISESKLNTYDATCGTNGVDQDEKVIEIIDSIHERTTSVVVCNSSADAFAASIQLTSDHWCIDSGGTTKSIPSALNTSPAELKCP